MAFHVEPVVDRLAEHLRGSSKLFMDETPVPVLDPGRGRTKTGYLWVLARDDRGWSGNDPPGILYHYAPGRSGKHAEQLLQGFDGILQVDGYGGYNRLTKAERQGGAPLVLAHCWTHARRQLKEIVDRDGSTIAAEGLAQIAALYRIEAEIRGRPSAERLAVRESRSRPLVEAFGQWLRAQRARVSRKSRIGEKLTYIATKRLPADAGRFGEMVFEILKYHVVGDVAAGSGEVAASPEVAAPVAFAELREFLLDAA